jgi:esterase/lipase superfamily enzyme
VYCVDSVDAESFYADSLSPGQRILHHLQYEKYILDEVLPFSKRQNPNESVIAAGCSLGAYHAINIACKHPQSFVKAIGMSGRYDLTKSMGNFRDLFDGYMDENIVYNMPNLYIPSIGEQQKESLLKLKIILAIGQEDVFLEDNRLLDASLSKKDIPHEFYIWDGEAHNQEQWKQMLNLYL